ncbi:SO_0444 family Cu/Zn efflux transporter [Magnetococcus sp. PR-3]|uniref:SO_0444 family Cu/Zn efflux transporter n=1 Tax=Magnetococcus sp. PR-3 TaxID=3120355 RepID=UPI002FCE2594
MPIFWGATIGAPYPLCSCSVIPMALALRKQGASKSSTVSFLVATPETGVDSILVSWIMLGPWLTVIRPVSAIFCAIFAGLLTWWWQHYRTRAVVTAPATAVSLPVQSSSISVVSQNLESGGCCSNSSCCDDNAVPLPEIFWQRNLYGVRYAINDLFDDLALWIFAGLLLAAVVLMLVPPGQLSYLAGWGVTGLFVVMLMSVPIYVCATASTPLAAAMLHAGISPGMALVFLLTGPATSMVTLALLGKELGRATLVTYLVGIGMGGILCGVVTDWLFKRMAWPVTFTPLASEAGINAFGLIGVQWLSTALFLSMVLRFLWKSYR